MKRLCSSLFAALCLAGCSDLLTSHAPVSHAYVLRAAPHENRADSEAAALPVALRVPQPSAGPGLDTQRILILRPDRQLDFYANGHWAAPIPTLVGSVVAETLRDNGAIAEVYGDAAAFPADYLLYVTVRRFEADYVNSASSPIATVELDCAVGSRLDPSVVVSFVASGSAPARENRMGEVVAAYQTALEQALAQVEQRTVAAISRAQSAKTSTSPSPR